MASKVNKHKALECKVVRPNWLFGQGVSFGKLRARCERRLIHTSLNKPLLAAVLLFWACLRLQGMDRWSALSQIESGDNDRAVGRAGEISRYQIKPKLWERYAPLRADWEKPQDSLAVVKDAMQERCKSFERSFHRPPDDFEFYVLWNAPAQIRRPTKSVSERAKRFRNLVTQEQSQARWLGPMPPNSSKQETTS